jgi:hypothetical protein
MKKIANAAGVIPAGVNQNVNVASAAAARMKNNKWEELGCDFLNEEECEEDLNEEGVELEETEGEEFGE